MPRCAKAGQSLGFTTIRKHAFEHFLLLRVQHKRPELEGVVELVKLGKLQSFVPNGMTSPLAWKELVNPHLFSLVRKSTSMPSARPMRGSARIQSNEIPGVF